MYDEFERALTGKAPRKGLSPLGWIGVGVGMVMLVGAVGVGYGATHVAHRVRHVAHELAAPAGRDIDRMVSRLDRSSSVVVLDPDAGLSFLRSLDSGDPSQALVSRLVGSRLDLSGGLHAIPDLPGVSDIVTTTIRSGRPDVRVDVNRGNGGGSVELSSKDGHVRFDLVKRSGGGTLTIDSDNGHARIDFARSHDGGKLLIQSDEGTVELGVGSSSRSTPDWVPVPRDMPDGSRPVFSLTTPDALLGAVAWKDDIAPGERVASFRKSLEDDGYQVEAEHSRSGPDGAEASLWARREQDGRTVFLLARRLDGRTHEVLGYGHGN